MIEINSGHKIDGTLDKAIVKIADEWKNIIVIKAEHPQKLSGSNSFVYNDVRYITDGHIKTINEDGMSYVWLYLKYSENYISDIKSLRKQDKINKQDVDDVATTSSEVLMDNFDMAETLSTVLVELEQLKGGIK